MSISRIISINERKLNYQINKLRNIDMGNILVGAEIEFYANRETSPADIKKILFNSNINNFFIEKECGPNQFEIQFQPYSDMSKLCLDLFMTRKILQEEVSASFFNSLDNEFGNALHFHINFLDCNGNNLFAKHQDNESELCLLAIGGMLSTLIESMAVFAPFAEDYYRFRPKSYAPTKVSWGNNNRSVALRIPSGNNQNRRVEHRVSSAASDPYLVLSHILSGIHYGIVNKIIPASAKIYGDANDEQYQLPSLPKSLKEAKKYFKTLK
jgi:glutamine synthetase